MKERVPVKGVSFPLPTLNATRRLARLLSAHLAGNEVVLLSGELGAGKTTFTRFLAEALGIDPSWVSSPSFTLVQRYPPGKRGLAITHVDLYRLPEGSDLEPLGLYEILASPDLVVVEWPASAEQFWAESQRPLIRVAFTGIGRQRSASVEGLAMSQSKS